ncbi:MAG: DUF1492 domain-containing protein [Dorea sp.]|nr:DUF1492 domain-containing protein [Dorea sp.]
MTAKEYLSQGYRLEQIIKLIKMDIEYWQDLASSVSSPGFEEHFNATRNTDAPFVKQIYKMMEYQDLLTEKLELHMNLKREMQKAIEEMSNQDERLVLEFRYIKNLTWPRIADLMYVDESTVRRWHNKALNHFVVPENPTTI